MHLTIAKTSKDANQQLVLKTKHNKMHEGQIEAAEERGAMNTDSCKTILNRQKNLKMCAETKTEQKQMTN